MGFVIRRVYIESFFFALQYIAVRLRIQGSLVLRMSIPQSNITFRDRIDSFRSLPMSHTFEQGRDIIQWVEW